MVVYNEVLNFTMEKVSHKIHIFWVGPVHNIWTTTSSAFIWKGDIWTCNTQPSKPGGEKRWEVLVALGRLRDGRHCA